jgi:hypothetical protein
MQTSVLNKEIGKMVIYGYPEIGKVVISGHPYQKNR